MSVGNVTLHSVLLYSPLYPPQSFGLHPHRLCVDAGPFFHCCTVSKMISSIGYHRQKQNFI